jgi:stearoyl-CoA desaturase (delta-9 desaturase)
MTTQLEDPPECSPSAAPQRPAARRKRSALSVHVTRWFDSWAGVDHEALADGPKEAAKVEWVRIAPFVILHLACLGVVWVGISWTAVIVAVLLYVVRMFAITAFYHRYFSHRSFKTSRVGQFVFGVLGNSAVQRGPLWWAAHHREHHRSSDEAADPHSPMQRGFWWSHIGWITARVNFPTRIERVRDLARFPELRFLDRFDTLVPALSGAALYGFGQLLKYQAPSLGTDGLQLLVWGVISTIVLFHATFTINSLAHLFGSRRFETADTSRNNPLLALITLGEGWHNNHHHYQGAARQGFMWWEYDFSYYGLVVLRTLGIVWDLNPVPARVMAQRSPIGRR